MTKWTDPKKLEAYYDNPAKRTIIQPPVAAVKQGFVALEEPRGLILGECPIARQRQYSHNTEYQQDAARLEDGQLLALPKFEKFMMQAPKVVTASKPNDKRSLMQPAERRALLEYEVGERRALDLKRKAAAETRRTHEVTRQRHPNGVLGVDSIQNLNSTLYGKDAERITQQNEHRTHHSDKRREKICTLTVSKVRHGYDPFSHNPEPLAIPSRYRKINSPRVIDNDRSFLRKGPNQDRAQHLRNRDLAGKNYNIVSHTAISHMPSTVPPSQDKVLAHPSQQSLERGRCLQGTLLHH